MARIREATRDDIESILYLISEDIIGKKYDVLSVENREEYAEWFDKISSDPTQRICVTEGVEGEILGTFQLTLLRYLFNRETRLLVEYVRVAKSGRGKGIGKEMFKWIISFAKEQEVSLIQLTTHKERESAHYFYRNLGFVDSHIGMKLLLR